MGVGSGGTTGDFAMTTFHSTQHAPTRIAEMSLKKSSILSYTQTHTQTGGEKEGGTRPHKINENYSLSTRDRGRQRFHLFEIKKVSFYLISSFLLRPPSLSASE